MSRLSKENIWFSHYYHKNNIICPICEKEILFKSKLNWHPGHIHSISAGGRDIFPNVIPICVKCNLSMKNIHFYEYLYKLGKITVDDKKKYIIRHDFICNQYNPICEYKNCPKRKLTIQEKYCNAHRYSTGSLELMDTKPD